MLNEDQANKTQCHQQVHDNYDLFQHLQLPAARQIAPNSSALRRLHLPAPIDIRHAEQLGCTCRLYTAAVKESHTFCDLGIFRCQLRADRRVHFLGLRGDAVNPVPIAQTGS